MTDQYYSTTNKIHSTQLMKYSHLPPKISKQIDLWVSADQERIRRNEIGLQWGGEERDAFLTNWQLCFRAHAEPMGGRAALTLQ